MTATSISDLFAELRQRFAEIPADDEQARDDAMELLVDVLRWALQQDGALFVTQSPTAGYLVTLQRGVKDEAADQTLTALAMISGVGAVERVPHDTAQHIADRRAKWALYEKVMEMVR
jgi:hypothetical protein